MLTIQLISLALVIFLLLGGASASRAHHRAYRKASEDLVAAQDKLIEELKAYVAALERQIATQDKLIVSYKEEERLRNAART